MGGLLAARVLADFYDDRHPGQRDEPVEPAAAAGHEQGRHVHGLLSSGSEVLGELFPQI